MATSPFAQFAPSDTQEINLPKAASLLGGAGATGSNNPAVLAMQQIMGYGEGPGSISPELLTLGDKARRGELNDIPQGYSSAAMVLDKAPAFDLAVMAGLPPMEAMTVANLDLKQNLQAATQPKAQPEPKATEAFNDILASTATRTAVGAYSADQLMGGDVQGLIDATKGSVGPKVAAKVATNIGKIINPDDSLKLDDPETDLTPFMLEVKAKEWTDLIWGDARPWLNTNINNVLEGLDISSPEGEAWWDDLTEETQANLIAEIQRSVATFQARPAQPGPDEPEGIGGPWQAGYDVEDLEEEFGSSFTPEMPPLGSYSKWIDNGIPLHKNIYQSLGLNSLPSDLRYMKHVKQALDLRFPTTLGAWYLGGLFEDEPLVQEAPEQVSLRNDADRFVEFVMRGDSPFQVSLNPEDTREMFKEFVLASRASQKTYAEITGESGSYSSEFQERWELVNPWATGYDIKTERAILKAQAGWTGIGERGRLRERALDNLQAIYARKRLVDPNYTEGFIAFASSIKGSPWYVEG
jgi:hypothetical protein